MQNRTIPAGRIILVIHFLVLLRCAVRAYPQADSQDITGTYHVIPSDGWTNYTLPDGTMAEVAPLPETNHSVLTLDKRHFCSQTSTLFSAGIQTMYYGRWRMQHDTLVLTYSKQKSNLWWSSKPMPIRPRYIVRYIVDPANHVLYNCNDERKPVFSREADA